ncbi:MAG: hypothetical protein LBD90_07150 [Bifidobacteriaceae bacterium]|jgi:hypothetical protein|nr:hypothetical protein [Bifidobacteriaceae bacterium]
MDSTTIRISTRARDQLGELSSAQGISAAKALARLIDQAWWHAAWAAERAAQAADSANPEVAAEDSDWEETLADGVA